MLAHGVHLVSQVCQFAELIEHVVYLIGSVGSGSGNLAGVDDYLLCPDCEGEERQQGGDDDTASHHSPPASCLMASIGPTLADSSRKGRFFSLLDS